MTMQDLHRTEAEHLREVLLRARGQLESAGFQGQSLEEQLAQALQWARVGEECQRQLAQARERIAQLEGSG
jgi:hypothetical protein